MSSGSLYLLPKTGDQVRHTTIPGPLTCIASSSSSATSFAAAGKEVDVSIWDVERTFESSREITKGEKKDAIATDSRSVEILAKIENLQSREGNFL